MLRPISLMIVTALIAGCANLTDKTDPSAKPSGLFSSFTDPYSQWYYDSLPLCQVNGSDLEDFVLPYQVNLWDRLREGFHIDVPTNKRIQQEVNWYAKHPSYMARVSERGSRYLYYIVGELEKRNMPLELALLPIVESAFDPFAYSHGRASGMWQVIPGTGKMLGLKQNWWYDGRRDVVASTDAALDYLEQLHKQMDGDWLLALASYNSGAGNVSRAIRKNRKKGLPIDYWSLDLPKETEAYVPRLMAIKSLVANPEHYGVTLFDVPNTPFFEIVETQSQIDLAQAATLAELQMDDFYALNPAYNRWATDPDGPHTLLLPVDKAENFRLKLAQIPADQRVTWDRYTIKSGDSLSTIAAKYNTTTESLQAINDIHGVSIRAGKTLLVPLASANANHYTYSLNQRIQRKQSQGNGNKINYKVKSGDSLWTIGRRYKVSTAQIAKWNGMAPSDPIRPGQILAVWTRKPNSSSSNKTSNTVRKLAYKVRKGDSLARIASKFNVRINDILQWNKVNPKHYIQPGDHLTLFVDVTRIN